VIKKYLKLEDVVAYQIATRLSDYVWKVVSAWDWFNKRTLGVQVVEAVDSIAGNIAEGFGRFHKKDKQKFYFNSRGSVYESAHWINKAKARNLISQVKYDYIMGELRELPKEINYQIKMTEEKLKE
jgi:four helix bundle protein